ncbi:MAG TPA: TadE/TadG family type IV pilus assembly protein [Streptosporangiaceae bacterium]|nr:TadE/TadG family type IV pilus assembly protein [Streptosporangiaceae bacterium]
MRKLARRLLHLAGRDDRGAVGVIVAVLVAGGVLLGSAALVIDVGQIYQNRAELQNGADAAALGIARQCLHTQGPCVQATAQSTALGYGNSNASTLTQDTAGVFVVCGSDGLSSCSSSIYGDGLTSCPKDPTDGSNFVDVLTETKLKSGSTLLPPVFARTIVGNSTYNGTTVKACAQAEWGGALQSDSLALTLSLCQWQDLTSSGGSGFNTPVAVFIKGKAKQCAGPAGQNMPGGFDWLQQTSSSTCTAYIDLTTDTTVNNTGNNVSGACKAALVDDVNSAIAGKPVTVFVPVFGCNQSAPAWCPVTGTGSNAQYYVVGLAGFEILGYANIPGLKDNGTNSACTSVGGSGGNAPCIEGQFAEGLDPVANHVTPTPGPFGANGIKLTG